MASPRARLPRFRSLSSGEVISQTFEAYRRLFRQVAPIPLLLVGSAYVASVVSGVWVWWPYRHDFRLVRVHGAESLRVHGSPGHLLVPIVVTGLLALLLLVLQVAQAAAVVAVAGQGYLGTAPSWRAAVRTAFRRMHSLVWVVALALVAWLTGLVLLSVLVTLTGTSRAPVAAAGAVASLAVAIGLGALLSLVVPIVMFEHTRGGRAVARSFRLVWRRLPATTVTLAAVVVLVFLVDLVCQAGLSGVSGAGGAGVAARAVVVGLVELLISPLLPLSVAFVYFDTRNRREGIDLAEVAASLDVPVPVAYPPAAPPVAPPPGWAPAWPSGPPPAPWPRGAASGGPPSPTAPPEPVETSQAGGLPPEVSQPAAPPPAWPALSPKPRPPHRRGTPGSGRSADAWPAPGPSLEGPTGDASSG